MSGQYLSQGRATDDLVIRVGSRALSSRPSEGEGRSSYTPFPEDHAVSDQTYIGTHSCRAAHELGADDLAATVILYLPHIHDQFHLRSLQPLLLDFLARGGHMILCAEPAIPCSLSSARSRRCRRVPSPTSRSGVRNDPLGFFRNMDADFDGWCGIFGQYARGWPRMPNGAVWLTDIGSKDAPRPADWLWQYPTDDGRGGLVFMHNGNNMVRYPDHGEHRQGLVRDICLGLVARRGPPLNRF